MLKAVAVPAELLLQFVQQFADEIVGPGDGLPRFIDEAALQRLPACGVLARPVSRDEALALGPGAVGAGTWLCFGVPAVRVSGIGDALVVVPRAY